MRPRRDLLVGFAFVGLFFMYVATATFDQQQNIDTLSTLVPAWQLASHGDVYADQYAGFTPWFYQHGEHVVSNRLPGAILWATPFYALLGRGGDFAPVFPAAVASAAAATLAALFVYLAVRRLGGRRVGLVAAFTFALATPTWSVSADALWTHGPAQMLLALSLVLAADDRFAAMGLAQAGAILTRPHLAVVAACMGAGAAIKARSVRPLVVVGLTSGLGLLALATYYRLVYGTWTLSGGYGSLGGYGETPGLSSVSERVNGTSPFLRNVAEALVSPGRGLFVYSPFLLLLLPGLRAAWSTAPAWVRSAAVGGLVYAVVQLWGNGYSGEDFFSYRFLLEPLTLWTPLLTLAYLGWAAARPRVALAFWLLLAMSFAWQAAAATSSVTTRGALDVRHSTGYALVWDDRPVVVVTLLLGSCAAVLWWAGHRDGRPDVTGPDGRDAGGPAGARPGRPTASSARPTGDPASPSGSRGNGP